MVCTLHKDESFIFTCTCIVVLINHTCWYKCVLIAMYEKDGVPAEQYLKQVIEMKFIRPGIRRYKVENLYEQLRERENMEKEVEALEAKQRKWKEERIGKGSFKKEAAR